MAKKTDTNASNMKIFQFSEFSSDIRRGDVRSVYLFFGDETYLIDKAVEAISRKVLAPGSQSVDMHTIDAKGVMLSVEVLKEQVYTPPFLSSKRLIIVKNLGIFTSSDMSEVELENFAKLIQNIPDTSCVVFLESKIDKRKKSVLKAFGDHTMRVEVSKQKGEDLCRWVATALKKENIRISVDAVTSLVDRSDNDMRLLENEVKKLIMFSQAQSIQEIKIETIDHICAPDIRGSVFQMSDAIGMRQTEKALAILDRLIILKEPVTKIRFMLARHVRHLICAKDINNASELAQRLKVMPFVARKLTEQARSFSKDYLEQLYDLCFMSDYKIKKGKIDEQTALELLLIRAGNVPVPTK